MKTETAIQASKLIKEIEDLARQINLIKKVSEFTEITFTGEGGAEKQYTFAVKQTELKSLLLRTAEGYLRNSFKLKSAELEKL